MCSDLRCSIGESASCVCVCVFLDSPVRLLCDFRVVCLLYSMRIEICVDFYAVGNDSFHDEPSC